MVQRQRVHLQTVFVFGNGPLELRREACMIVGDDVATYFDIQTKKGVVTFSKASISSKGIWVSLSKRAENSSSAHHPKLWKTSVQSWDLFQTGRKWMRRTQLLTVCTDSTPPVQWLAEFPDLNPQKRSEKKGGLTKFDTCVVHYDLFPVSTLRIPIFVHNFMAWSRVIRPSRIEPEWKVSNLQRHIHFWKAPAPCFSPFQFLSKFLFWYSLIFRQESWQRRQSWEERTQIQQESHHQRKTHDGIFVCTRYRDRPVRPTWVRAPRFGQFKSHVHFALRSKQTNVLDNGYTKKNQEISVDTKQ